MDRRFISLGALLAFLGVGLGAFGTHGLRARVSERDLETWTTGVHYHLVHGVALLAVGALIALFPNIPATKRSGWLFLAGIAVFSGSLYVLVISGQRWLGAVTPLGGLCFLAGWLNLALAFARRPS